MTATLPTASYEEAIDRYVRAVTAWADIVNQPNRSLSYRNDKDTGWVFNNVNGYLAFVPDRGGVLFR